MFENQTMNNTVTVNLQTEVFKHLPEDKLLYILVCIVHY